MLLDGSVRMVEVRDEVAVTTAPFTPRHRVDFRVRVRVNAFERFVFAVADVFIENWHLQAGRAAVRRIRARHRLALEKVHELAVWCLVDRLMAVRAPVARAFLARRYAKDKRESRLR